MITSVLIFGYLSKPIAKSKKTDITMYFYLIH